MTRSIEVTPLHIVHFIAGLQASGAETALCRLVEQSDPAKVRHTVVSLTDRGDLSARIESAGATVIDLRLRGGSQAIFRVAQAFNSLWRLRPDVLQGWMVHGNLAAWAIRFFLHPRARLAWNLRMSLRDAIHETRRTMMLTRMAGRFSRSVDLLLSNSANGLEDHLAIGYRPRSSAVVANGFDVTLFRPLPDERAALRHTWRLSPDTVAYGLVGRYHPAKGHDLFIRASAHVMRAHEDVVFVLAGRDATVDNPELPGLLERYGVSSRFILLGARDDIPVVMSALDVIAIPSVYEGFPNALGEAMAAGKAVVATDVSDIALIMQDAGRLVMPGDEAGLAEAMLDLHAIGPEGRAAMGAAARAIIEERYAIGDFAERYADQYARLCS